MRLPILAIFITSCLMASAQILWQPDQLTSTKNNIAKPYYAKAYKELLREADEMIDLPALSVMQKEATAASGDKHDYLSQARYFWPNPNTSDGLPYINRDGVTNPEIELLDRNRLGATAHRIATLGLAYYLSDNEKYAAKAVELAKTWFLNPDTRMNPNLKYAQIVPGQNGNLGRCYGLLDTYSFVNMIDALIALERSPSLTTIDALAIRRWFNELSQWMIDSEQGREESRVSNNHSIAYDAQIIAFSLYGGNFDTAHRILNEFARKRLASQIEADGSQPAELGRTRSFHYSQYNLSHIIDILYMARNAGINIDSAQAFKAIDFMLPYVGKDALPWPYEQLDGLAESQQLFYKDLYRASQLGSDNSLTYRKVYESNRILDYSDNFNLVEYEATEADHALTFAWDQLQYALECAENALNDEYNKAHNLVSPRSISEGKLTMVDERDWCSGFFAGSLWQMYEYSLNPIWRKAADRWTWLIEGAKTHKGTHDLGFMINDSFGKGYALTGDTTYRDVVIESANTLITRYNPTVGLIRSWDHNAQVWKYPVIIDNMMNLELLFDATNQTGDNTYHNIAISHADLTMRNHFRPDYSSYHVVDYDPGTGKIRMKVTAQGYSDDSFWSRGQSWGLYAYSMCYRYTHNPAYLHQSQAIADFFFSLPNLPGDLIPYWDMKAPGTESATPEAPNAEIARDASTAAIMASGLYELSCYVTDNFRIRYRDIADRILASLTADYQAPARSNQGFLLLHSTGHHPGNSEIDVPICYADYFYIEALLRQRRLK